MIDRRDQLIDFVEREFIGPDPIDWPELTQENGEEILITDPPRQRYIAGILFPKETRESDVSVNEEEVVFVNEAEGIDDGASGKNQTFGSENEYLEDAEELINCSNAYKQSAMSITACMNPDDAVYVRASAGIYKPQSFLDIETQKKTTRYYRQAIEWDNDGKKVEMPTEHVRIRKYPVGTTGLQFDITYRHRTENAIIYTFTLENTKDRVGESIHDEDCFFQVKFRVSSNRGFLPLPEDQRVTEDEDYLSNLLLYRNVFNYAIGHGCAAGWDDGEPVQWISTAVFPTYDLKPIVPSKIEGVSLEMLKMSPYGNISETIAELHLMCNRYRDWINGLKTERNRLESRFRSVADRHVTNCEECLSRMEKGISLLEQNEQVRTAFQYMNLAMLMQQLHFNLPLQRWIYNEQKDTWVIDAISLPNVEKPETWSGNRERYGKWRPFQLAFILMNLRSINDKQCSEREIVDLIWFPTGGGKTEAYLGLSAYTIFLRRLQNKEDSGTAILMRYTLRLLTAQQYERASSMICACDKIRSEHEDLFGISRISIGLWVGSSTTPNTVKDAVKAYEDLYDGETDNPFIMLKCPWCGAQMGPVAKRFVPGYKKTIGPHRTYGFIFQCSNRICDYSRTSLPLYVVDETIYKKTPTLLLGTVDKFAMLPFRPEAQSLFGYENGEKKNSPDLIIQDELHLISGPLGSMVGHYETLINELCTTRTPSGEIKPKIIASTATISRAKEQCHALYACSRENVFQFPPAGLDAGNSFFAEEDKSQNGRRYVGVLATGSSSDATTAIRMYASLLYGAKAMQVSEEKERDPYWTNMGYYNSIRELGQAATWIRADIDQHLDVMYKRRFEDKKYSDREQYRNNRRYIRRDKELTSRISGSEVTESLAELSITYPPKQAEDEKTKEHPIDICLATNMISVGLDVPRLGLMTVVGQPKTTSEYIQATSRVGRDSTNAPGLVFVLYRPGRPRDKSHYEHFKAYHSRMYCNVEPTSVTPFSSPVRERALHAIMIGIMRLEGDASFNSDPPRFPSDDLYEKVQNIIENRVDDVDVDELNATIRQMDDIMCDWRNWNPRRWEAGYTYDMAFRDEVPLMYSAGSRPNEAWGNQGIQTPTSMRNVDASCEAEPLTRYVVREE